MMSDYLDEQYYQEELPDLKDFYYDYGRAILKNYRNTNINTKPENIIHGLKLLAKKGHDEAMLILSEFC